MKAVTILMLIVGVSSFAVNAKTEAECKSDYAMFHKTVKNIADGTMGMPRKSRELAAQKLAKMEQLAEQGRYCEANDITYE